MTDININEFIINNNNDDDTLSIISEIEIETESIIDDDIYDDINYMYNTRWTKYIELFRTKYSDPLILDIDPINEDIINDDSIQDSIEN